MERNNMCRWGRRVKQDLGGETIYSVYALSGQLLHRDNDTGGAATDYVSLGGRSIARRENGVVTYLHSCHCRGLLRLHSIHWIE